MAWVAIVQGCYFVITGAWPLVHIESFQRVTGRKTDLWLARTVGILVLIIGVGLLVGALTQHLTAGLILIAIASALGLMGIDLTYAFKRVISLVYVLDALLEAGLVAWWAMFLLATSNSA